MIGGLKCFVECTTMTWMKSYHDTLLRVDFVGTKGVSQYHLLSFDNNKVLKIINWIC